MSRKIFQKKKTEANAIVWSRLGGKYNIFKMYRKLSPDLTKLKPTQSVVYGNGKNYYYLLELKMAKETSSLI